MGDPQDLLRLADELMAATGPDRRLDYWIMTRTVPTGRGYLWDPEDQNHRYTASLDAAMTLAPEGWYLRVEPRFYSEEGQVRWRAHAIRPDWSRWTPYDDWFDTIENIDADQPALALCAAALKARAHSTKESDNG